MKKKILILFTILQSNKLFSQVPSSKNLLSNMNYELQNIFLGYFLPLLLITVVGFLFYKKLFSNFFRILLLIFSIVLYLIFR
jgi:hypothetical protein